MMKKVIKKLLAALLAVAMVCAMAIPAFAYDPGETEEDLGTKPLITALSRSSRVLLRVRILMTLSDVPTLGGPATSLILTSFLAQVDERFYHRR